MDEPLPKYEDMTDEDLIAEAREARKLSESADTKYFRGVWRDQARRVEVVINRRFIKAMET